MGGFNFGTDLPIKVPKRDRGEVHVFVKKFSKLSEFDYLEPGIYPSIADVVESKNILIQDGRNHCESCIRVEVSQRKQKKTRYSLQLKALVFHSLKWTWEFFSRTVFSNLLDWCSKENYLNNNNMLTTFSANTLMMHTDLVEYNIIGDTKAPLLRCCFLVSKLKAGDFVTTGQHIHYQSFRNKQVIPLLKNSFHSIHIGFKDTSDEKNPSNMSVSIFLCWYLGSLQHSFVT